MPLVGSIGAPKGRNRIGRSQTPPTPSYAKCPIAKIEIGRRFEGGASSPVGEWQKMASPRRSPRIAQLPYWTKPTAALTSAVREGVERFAELTEGKMAMLIFPRFSTVRM